MYGERSRNQSGNVSSWPRYPTVKHPATSAHAIPIARGAHPTKATVTAASTSRGMILIDGGGRTLYLFAKDQPNQSACNGACVAAWPVDQSSGTPKAGSGVKASLLGMIRRSDGTAQVAYNGHPLYYYSGDSGAGQLNGQGVDAFGAKWYVVTPAGGADTGA